MKAHTQLHTEKNPSEIFELCGLNLIDKNYNHQRLYRKWPDNEVLRKFTLNECFVIEAHFVS